MGIEVNPFLCFASRVKTAEEFDPVQFRQVGDELLSTGKVAIDRVERGNTSGLELPEMPRLEAWMARRVALKVVALRDTIRATVAPEHRDVPMSMPSEGVPSTPRLPAPSASMTR